jgi:hypothetical protein
LPDPLRPLKLLVAVLTAMLLVGGAVLAWGIARQLGEAGAKPRGWGTVALGQPAGTRVVSETAVGALMVLRLSDASGDNLRHVVVDPATGAVLGTFRLGAP